MEERKKESCVCETIYDYAHYPSHPPSAFPSFGSHSQKQTAHSKQQQQQQTARARKKTKNKKETMEYCNDLLLLYRHSAYGRSWFALKQIACSKK
jgi:hypothetical protein